MKKLIFILFLFTCIKASAQIPIRSFTNVADKSLYVDNHFTPPRYNDTTQANLNLGLDSCGAIIFTRIDQKLWKRVCNPTKHWEEIGLEDTVYVRQPLYVDAGVKDTLKFNADSSGLVRDAMRSNDSVYIKINGEWVFAFIDSVGSGGGGGNVDYVLQGWGIKVDSTGRNYTVKADSSVLATFYKVQQDSLAIVGNMWKLGGNNIAALNDSLNYIGISEPSKMFNVKTNYNLAARLYSKPDTLGMEGSSIVQLGFNVYNDAPKIAIGSRISAGDATPYFSEYTTPIAIGNNLFGKNIGSPPGITDTINAIMIGNNIAMGDNILPSYNQNTAIGNQIVLDDEQKAIVIGSNNYLNNLFTMDDGIPYETERYNSHIILGNNTIPSSSFVFTEHPTFFLSPNIKQLNFPLNGGNDGDVLTRDINGYSRWAALPPSGTTEYLNLTASADMLQLDSVSRNYFVGLRYNVLKDSIQAVSNKLITDSTIWNKIGTNKWELRNTSGNPYGDTLSIGKTIMALDEATGFNDYLIMDGDALTFNNSFLLQEDPIFQAGLDYIFSRPYQTGSSTTFYMNSPSGVGRAIYLPKMTVTDTLANKLWVTKTISDSAKEIKLFTPLNVEEDTVRLRYNFTSANPLDTLKMANVGTLVELANTTVDTGIYLDANTLTNMKVGETIKLFNNNATNFDFEIYEASGTTLRGNTVIPHFGSAEIIKRNATTYFILNTQ